MHKKRAGVLTHPTARKPEPVRLTTVIHMIIHITVTLKEIFRLGRNYPWPRPERCPRCHCFKVWGHGYQDTFFEGFKSALPLKRWRCPQCGCVICYRPKGYFPRFQSSIQTIRSVISHRLQCGRWPSGFIRCRAGHWLQSLKKQVAARLGNTWQGGLPAAFDYFIGHGQIPVSRSI
ncbi:MAG: hypothetical protein K9K82_02965 [Desulfobacteraceae bacterium]|nr:hypothetical protein [Desulfobacteraceae bacterium]